MGSGSRLFAPPRNDDRMAVGETPMQLSDRITGPFLVAPRRARRLWRLAAAAGAGPADRARTSSRWWSAIGLALCGVMIALGDRAALRGGGRGRPRTPTRTPIPESERHHGPLYGLRALIPPALLIFYVLVVERLGFVPTAAIIVLVAALALGASWRARRAARADRAAARPSRLLQAAAGAACPPASCRCRGDR